MTGVKHKKQKAIVSGTHSGVFTISNLNDEEDYCGGLGHNFGVEVDGVPIDKAKDINGVANEASPVHTEENDKPIDDSFEKLFACMSIAYSAQLTSPKFKAFRGLKVTVKDKMRMNNIIWREWFLQFKGNKKAQVCRFHVGMDDPHKHAKEPQITHQPAILWNVVVLEGKYWKRMPEVVCAEYMKWRVFNKKRIRNQSAEVTELLAQLAEDGQEAISAFVKNQKIVAHYSPPNLTSDDYKMDMSDDIFNTLQSVGFPHQTTRDLMRLENADFMQPQLLGLEPDLYFHDFTASDPLQDVLSDVLLDIDLKPGQKRPNYNELVAPAVTFTENMCEPPPSYPAHKRSRVCSIPTLPPATTMQSASTDLSSMCSIQPHSSAVQSTSSFIQPPAITNTNSISNWGPPSTTYLQTTTGHKYQTVVGSYQTIFQEPAYTSHYSLNTSCNQPLQSKSVMAQANNTVNGLLATATNEHPDDLLTLLLPDYPSMATTSYQGSASTVSNLTPVSEFKVPSSTPAQTNLATSGKKKLAPKPQPHEKSTFLTQLLRYPLDRESDGNNPATTCCIPPLPTSTPQSNDAVFHPPPPPSMYNNTQQLRSPTLSTISPSSIKSRHYSAPSSVPATVGAVSSNTVPTFDNQFPSSSEEDRKDLASAEQKRRHQIKNGFDYLGTLLPETSNPSSSKTSKAVMLSQAVKYITELQEEKESMTKEISLLRSEIEAVNSAVINCQAQLPDTGVPLMTQNRDHMRVMLQSHVRDQTLNNYKYYILSKLAMPLFDAFYSTVSTASEQEMSRTTNAWLDQHCTLLSLRSSVLTTLRELGVETDILTDPARFPEQVRAAVLKPPSDQPT